jgi:hypothetical protein
MATMLPGLGHTDPAKFAFAFDGPSYTQIVADTLGKNGLPGDDLELAQAELSDLMDAFTADVTNDKDFGSLPTGRVFGGTIAALTTIGAELDASDALHTAIGLSFDSLALTFGVWGIFDALVQAIQDELRGILTEVFNAINALALRTGSLPPPGGGEIPTGL